MAESSEPLNGKTGVTRSLLLQSLTLVLLLVGVVWGMTVARIATLEDRVLRAEATLASRGERIAILEASRASLENTVTMLDRRADLMDVHLAAIDVAIASHRAATERRRGE